MHAEKLVNKTCIVIVTYNGMRWLQKCLESTKNYPVVIVDNGSTDETVSFIKENHPSVHIIVNSENKGFGQANNQGVSWALEQGADSVFLFNQDAYLREESLEKLRKISEENPTFGILSPVHVTGNEDDFDENFYEFITRVDVERKMLFSSLYNKLDTLYEVPFVNAAAWFIPKKTLETVGGFDPLFFHYGEDNNFCQRVRYHHLKIGIVPEATIIHDRAERLSNEISEEQYWKNKKLKLLVAKADVNNELSEEIIEKQIQYLKKKILSSKLKRDTTSVKDYQMRKDTLSENKEGLLKSWSLNREVGSHYLDISE